MGTIKDFEELDIEGEKTKDKSIMREVMSLIDS